MAVIDANGDNFRAEVLDTKGLPVLVDFWAPWCGPCQMQGPILDDLAGEVDGKAKIVKVNVDENTDLASQYGVMSIPALKVFKDGSVVEEMVGVHQKDQLLEVIRNHS
jgi:thioredoxin 1